MYVATHWDDAENRRQSRYRRICNHIEAGHLKPSPAVMNHSGVPGSPPAVAPKIAGSELLTLRDARERIHIGSIHMGDGFRRRRIAASSKSVWDKSVPGGSSAVVIETVKVHSVLAAQELPLASSWGCRISRPARLPSFRWHDEHGPHRHVHSDDTSMAIHLVTADCLPRVGEFGFGGDEARPNPAFRCTRPSGR